MGPSRFENNFNLLRFVAATLVILSHSYALIDGTNNRELLNVYTGITLGNLGVYVFFAISGFLITGSIVSSASLWNYLVKRALRIYPALICSVLLTVLFGSFISSMSIRDYYNSRDTVAYLFKNSTLLLGLHYNLPGVFTSNPFPGLVNGSLWTLPEELKMYIAIAFFGTIGLIRRKVAFAICLFAVCVVIGVFFSTHTAAAITIYFAAGALVYTFKDKIRYRLVYCLISVSAIVGIIIFQLPTLLLAPPVVYLIFFFAFSRNDFLFRFNDYGDYSYGLYIYAYPIQQFLVLKGIHSPIKLFGISFLLTFICAFASWHLIEKRAIKLKPAR